MTVESVQFAIFLVNPTATKSAVAAARELFPDRFPNSFNEMGPGQSVATFSDPDYQITVASLPGRHDVVIQRNTGEKMPGSLPIDPSFVEREHLDLVGNFARTANAARLAVVVKSYRPARNRAEAVTHFQRSVPGVAVPSGTTEVDYKVNVPRYFRVSPHLQMNRLRHWFTAGITLMMVGPGINRAGETQWQLVEEVDVSSATDGTIELSKSNDILKELYDEALFHLNKGPESLESLLDAP